MKHSYSISLYLLDHDTLTVLSAFCYILRKALLGYTGCATLVG